MDDIIKLCKTAKQSCSYIQNLSEEQRNKMLNIIADSIIENAEEIIAQNQIDVKNLKDKPDYFIDRLTLTKARIIDMAGGLKQLISLPCPVGETIESWINKDGLKIKKIRVPLGVVGIIYEARPNVTVDTVGICIKSGNSLVLRGSKDAINSNKALIGTIKASLAANSINTDFIQLVTDTTHQGAETLMNCREFVDVLIPRGSSGLIDSVVKNSSVPVIETGIGNCHAYVEQTADFEMAKNIILNGKLQRPSVCNALESLIVDRKIAKDFIPFIYKELSAKGVTMVGCEEAVLIEKGIGKATEQDFYTEFLALKISVIVLADYNEAIAHINKYGSGHSEVIITQNNIAAELFSNQIDSAAVYVNASTRFTDGFEFGFGAEMGISTQKLHARGPIGLKQLTSEKYIICGNGQVRK